MRQDRWAKVPRGLRDMLEILPDEPVKAGEIVAHRYRLDRVVGEGGMGVVWAATHVLTEKTCALKFLKAGRASDPRSHSRLLNEARATCRVRHPNVAPVHDILELPNGVPFIVMDLLDGEPLSARLRRVGSLGWKDTVELLVPTIDAIMAAHAQGVIHRDLKPDNVFLERRDNGGFEGKVLDFGIAKRFDLERDLINLEASEAPRNLPAHGLTTTHSALGTPSYMAPEQIRHDGDVGVPADVWMLGMLAYECLTGRRPERDAVTFGISSDVAEAYLSERGEGVSGEAIAIVMSMLRFDPTERPALADLRTRIKALEHSPAEHSAPKRTTAIFSAFAVILASIVFFGTRHHEPQPGAAVVVTSENLAPPAHTASAARAALPVVAAAASSTETQSPPSGVALKPAKKSAPAISAATASEGASQPAPAASSANVVIPSYERH